MRVVVTRLAAVGPVSTSSPAVINGVLADAGAPPVGCFPSFVSEVLSPSSSGNADLTHHCVYGVDEVENRDPEGEGECELDRMRDVLEPGEYRKFFLGKILENYIRQNYNRDEIDAMRAKEEKTSALTEHGAWRGMFV